MRFLAALALTILFSVVPSLALDPERRDAVVISGRVWDGFDYKENLIPSTHRDFQLLSKNDNAISFVGTLEYYWPLARQVYVDFEAKRDQLVGVLHIEQAGKTVAEIVQSEYAIIYPEGAINGHAQLAWGDAAAKAFADYEASEREFAKRYVDAQRAGAEYERKLLAEATNRKAGAVPEVIPPPPPLPEPSLRLITKPVVGYRVSLEPGIYQISLYDDKGVAVSGTRRTLHVVEANGRAAVVADIVPEERWTRPLASNDLEARIFAKPGATFYVTLADADRFDETEYLPVISPQAAPVPGRSMWVRRKTSSETALNVSWQGQDGLSPLNLERLKVEQTQGSSFGYRVRSAGESEPEDLKAFQVTAPAEAEVHRGRLWLDEDGKFSREVVLVQARNTLFSGVAALFPLLAYLCIKLLFHRRRRTTNA